MHNFDGGIIIVSVLNFEEFMHYVWQMHAGKAF